MMAKERPTTLLEVGMSTRLVDEHGPINFKGCRLNRDDVAKIYFPSNLVPTLKDAAGSLKIRWWFFIFISCYRVIELSL